MASEVRRFTCLTCLDFSKERAASEDSRREKTLNSKRIRRSPNEAGATQVRGQTSDEKLRPRGKQQARITFIPLLLASYLFLWGFPPSLSCSLAVLFQNLRSGRRRGTSLDSRTGRAREGYGGVTAFSRLLLLPEIPSVPGRETPCPLNGVTGLPWLRGTPWNRRHRRAQRKAHLFWKNIIRTRARHEPHPFYDSRRMREKRRRANPMSIIHKRPRLSGLNVMFNVVDACDARSDNARREISGDCSRNSRNWRHAIN
ncbi:hypothetical protein ALC56_02768 [Trachymyrmex septentrionalis]|uniref:Transmembrane protein n=1 Tax=Trachymyrmex septentrionalis TaxID=34720 RepID=A0A195FR70_9HYME|nr:hypothetical protein ALC56_02768 [Trachymyrmex septentrionalis]